MKARLEEPECSFLIGIGPLELRKSRPTRFPILREWSLCSRRPASHRALNDLQRDWNPPVSDSYARAEAYFVDGGIVLGPVSGTRGSVLRPAEPRLRVEQTADAEELGRAVIRCLAASSAEIDVAADEARRAMKVTLRLAKVRSWKALEARARLVAIASRGSDVTFTPCSRREDAGFSELSDEAETCEREPGALGRTLLEVSRRCR